MWWIFLAMVAVFGGLGGVFVAMMYMNQKRKVIEAIPEITIRGEVISTAGKKRGDYPIHDPYKLGATRQSIVFLTDKNQYIQLNVSSKEYNQLLPGFYGDITYKANKLIAFKRRKGHEEQRLLEREEERLANVDTSGIYFYCEALFIGTTVPTDQPEYYSLDAVLNYISLIEERPSDQFFGLDNGVYVIQFSSSTAHDIILDIPDPSKGGAYQAQITDFTQVKELVKAYYQNQDVRQLVQLEWMQF
jgi:hypothetical protein